MSLPTALARTLYRLQEHLMGRPTFSEYERLARQQWLPRAQVLEVQRTRLNVLLRLALAHSPWHAARLEAAGLAPLIQRGTLDLEHYRRLPTMDRADARLNRESLVWHGVPGGAQRYNTGGSSGEPLIFYFGRDRQAADAACRLRARAWWGVAPGAPEAYLWGAPVELNRTDRLKRLRDWAVNHRIFNAFAMTPARMDEYLGGLRAFGPHSLYGYASSLALLASHLETTGQQPRLDSLRVVCTTGEPLDDQQRVLIERVFGVPVANEYGCRDGGLLAHEAPGGQLLVMSDCVIVELLDEAGHAVPAGSQGEVVVTNLASAAQPFLRYRTGDVAVASTAPPAGGQGLEVLERIGGRRTDFVVAADGTVMHALAVIYVLRAVEGVAQFRCVQRSREVFEVAVVSGPGWRPQAEEEIRSGLRARLGEQVDIRLTLTDTIPPERSGKHRYVVSELVP